MPGPVQIAIILFVIILLFGAKKLPALARSLGESITEFKKGREDLEEQSSTTASKSDKEKSETSAS